MHVDVILIGQGISGTFLSWNLKKAGVSFIVIDEPVPNTASRIAAGVINPVTGRRIVKTWLIDELLNCAAVSYNDLGIELNITAIEQKNIADLFPTPQMKLAFEKRIGEDDQYLAIPDQQDRWHNWLAYDFGFGEISPAYLVNLNGIIPAYRKKLLDEGLILEERFDLNKLEAGSDHIKYNDIKASYIIFCDGIQSAESPYFKNLPFALNKGEAILVEIDELSRSHIYKKGFNLVPWKENIFWLGASYLWEFDTDNPTPGFYQFANNWLQQTVKLPFKIVEHFAGIRPATLERRPFVGFHPIHKNIGILNGMGTKGCSLAPFFSAQLVQYIAHQQPIYPEANIDRFKRVLSK